MGFFSWTCKRKGCNGSLLSAEAMPAPPWMMDVVVIQSDGKFIVGEYDGYGRVIIDEKTYDCFQMDGGPGARTIKGEFDEGMKSPSCWHLACWVAVGCPTEYQGRSGLPQDQGFFLNHRRKCYAKDNQIPVSAKLLADGKKKAVAFMKKQEKEAA